MGLGCFFVVFAFGKLGFGRYVCVRSRIKLFISISLVLISISLFENCSSGFGFKPQTLDATQNSQATPILTGNAIYVDPVSGNDQNPGSVTSPLKSISAAVSVAKTLMSHAQSGVSINLNSGTYPVLDAISLGPELSGRAGSPLVIQAATGARPVLDGRMFFQPGTDGNWVPATVTAWDGSARNMYKFQLSNDAVARLQPYIQQARKNGENASQFFVSDVYLGDVLQVRSRHPNAAVVANWAFMHLCFSNPAAAGTSGCLAACFGGANNPVGCNPNIPTSPNNGLTPVVGIPQNVLPHPELIMDGKTEVVMTKNFESPRALVQKVPVANLPDANGQIFSYVTMNLTGTWASNLLSTDWSPSAPDKVHLENNLSFIDTPREWYFDENTMTLYLQPASTDDLTQTIGIPIPRKFFQFTGGTLTEPNRYVTIQGLTFQFSRWAYANNDGNSTYYNSGQGGHVIGGVIDGLFVDNITLQSNTFQYCGETAVAFGGYRLGLSAQDLVGRGLASHIIINQNRFTWNGGSAIRLDNYGNKITDNHVTYNYISNIGRVFTDAVAIGVFHTSNSYVTNNEIHQVPYDGIHIGRLGHYDINDFNLVDSNYIENALTVHDDGGGIYIEGSSGQIMRNTITGLGQLRTADALNIGFVDPGTSAALGIQFVYYGHDIYTDSYHSYWYIDGNHVEHSMNINSRTDLIGGSNSGGAVVINHPLLYNWTNQQDAACQTRMYGDLQFAPYSGASTSNQKPPWFTFGGPDSLDCSN